MLKRILFLLLMCLAITVATGCDSDDKCSGTECACEALVNDYIKMDKLTSKQKSEVTNDYVTSCMSVYDNAPACGSEYVDFVICVLVDTPRSYWEEQNELEDDCYEKYHTEDEIRACVGKLYQKCKSLDKAVDACFETNQEALDAYISTKKDPLLSVKQKIESWGYQWKDVYNQENYDL